MEKADDYRLRDAQSYDHSAASFDKFTELYSTYAVSALLDQSGASNADRIIDIGCGTGIVSIAAAKLPPAKGPKSSGWTCPKMCLISPVAKPREKISAAASNS